MSLRLRPRIRWVVLADSVLVIDDAHCRSVTLDAVEGAIFELGLRHSRAHVVSLVAAITKVDAAVAKEHVEASFSRFAQEGWATAHD